MSINTYYVSRTELQLNVINVQHVVFKTRHKGSAKIFAGNIKQAVGCTENKDLTSTKTSFLQKDLGRSMIFKHVNGNQSFSMLLRPAVQCKLSACCMIVHFTSHS